MSKTSTESPGSDKEKPALLKLIELMLAKPEDIKKETEQLISKTKRKYSGKKSSDEIDDTVTQKIISNYSYYAAFSGGITAFSSIIPGLGTVVAMTGGAAADTALCMKFQIEMTMAIACAYGHDITDEEEKRLCFIVAGLGAINEAAKHGTKK